MFDKSALEPFPIPIPAAPGAITLVLSTVLFGGLEGNKEVQVDGAVSNLNQAAGDDLALMVVPFATGRRVRRGERIDFPPIVLPPWAIGPQALFSFVVREKDGEDDPSFNWIESVSRLLASSPGRCVVAGLSSLDQNWVTYGWQLIKPFVTEITGELAKMLTARFRQDDVLLVGDLCLATAGPEYTIQGRTPTTRTTLFARLGVAVA